MSLSRIAFLLIKSITCIIPSPGIELAKCGHWLATSLLKAGRVMKRFKEASIAVLSLVLMAAIILVSGCAQRESFLSSGRAQAFVQDWNPPYLDILWVIDDRSPMNWVREHLVTEAQNFFVRLDNLSGNYQMGITTMDTLKNRGALKPAGTLLTKNLGSLNERVSIFGNLLSQVINLQTGAENTGFEATLLSLSAHFQPRSGVPLVLVFISDGDDFSVFPGVTQDPVDYVAASLLSLKGNKEELVRAYAINYIPASSSTTMSDIRCATRNNADIDKVGTGAIRPTGGAWFQDRYFRLARKLKGDTANLCSSFSSGIDLSGLRLKALPRTFKLESPVSDPSKLRVSVTDRNGQSLEIPWTLNTVAQEITFQVAPPEGSSIQILIAGN